MRCAWVACPSPHGCCARWGDGGPVQVWSGQQSAWEPCVRWARCWGPRQLQGFAGSVLTPVVTLRCRVQSRQPGTVFAQGGREESTLPWPPGRVAAAAGPPQARCVPAAPRCSASAE